MKNQMTDFTMFQIDNAAEQNQKEKFINYFFIMNFWMKALEEGKDVSSFFKRNGYSNTAIYGMGDLGKHLIVQLEKSSFPVVYTIQRDVINYNGTDFDLIKDINSVPKADAIVVTPLMEYTSIKEKLEKLTNSSIISLEEVILRL